VLWRTPALSVPLSISSAVYRRERPYVSSVLSSSRLPEARCLYRLPELLLLLRAVRRVDLLEEESYNLSRERERRRSPRREEFRSHLEDGKSLESLSGDRCRLSRLIRCARSVGGHHRCEERRSDEGTGRLELMRGVNRQIWKVRPPRKLV
jgi:hypothetical protein